MSRLREMHRKDTNHDSIVALARKFGMQVFSAPPLDLWAGINGRWYPVEIKAPEREGRADEFTPDQIEFFNKCRLFGTRWLVWRKETDVFNDYQELSK